jgi:pyruvate/2-oxoglutarate dehydrogenase complex dihydrolipoamide dehydrogenase (E3) component
MLSHNQTLLDNVRPAAWQNPTPTGRYNLVIIGAGSAGLVAAAGTAGLGGKVALIEKHFMGGDCLNTGCVPSKALIRSAHALAAVREAADYGIRTGEATADFSAVMERLRAVRAEISPHDSAERFRNLGVDVYFGTARFSGADTVEVAGQTLQFSKALIATGSRPFVLPIGGLEEIGYLTNETIFDLTEQPRRLAVIGGGPIGSELAQAFQRLGTAVTLLDVAPHILPREDEDAADIVQQSLVRDGVRLLLGVKVARVARENRAKVLFYEQDGQTNSVVVDEILLSVGRRPVVDGLNLEAVDVAYSQKGVQVNDYLQTTNPRIYAAGDVAVPYQFTHVAGQTGAIVVQNALFPAPKRKFSALTIPWVTYTDPEVAHVGLYPHEAEAKGLEITTFTQPMSKVDRAVADGETAGFVKIHLKRGTSEIVGATLVGRHAGEMIGEVTLAIQHKLGMGALAGLIHPYPTRAEVIAKAASEYNKTRLTPTVAKLFRWWLSKTR